MDVGLYWHIGSGGTTWEENTNEERKLGTDLSGHGNRIGKTGLQMARQILETHPGLGGKTVQIRKVGSFIYTN